MRNRNLRKRVGFVFAFVSSSHSQVASHSKIRSEFSELALFAENSTVVAVAP